MNLVSLKSHCLFSLSKYILQTKPLFKMNLYSGGKLHCKEFKKKKKKKLGVLQKKIALTKLHSWNAMFRSFWVNVLCTTLLLAYF